MNFMILSFWLVRVPNLRMILSLLIGLILFTNTASATKVDPPKPGSPEEGANFTVVVYDGTNSLPLELARVALYRGPALVRGKVTNPQGRAVFTDITPGYYRLVVRSVGYNPFSDSVLIDASHSFDSVTLFEENQQIEV